MTTVVGNGILPSVTAPEGKVKDLAKRMIDDHLLDKRIDAMGLHNLSELQRIAMNSCVTDGEVLARRRWRAPQFAKGLELPFQIELLEADYLDTSITSHGKNRVIEGIEYGPTGVPVAYHLFPEHPGGTDWRRLNKSVRVPARDIIHVRRSDRPGQVRGVSWFAPVMLTIGDASDYQEAEIIKQKMAALLAGIMESDVGPDGSPPDPTASAAAQLSLDWPTITKLSSATIRILLGTDYDHFPASIDGEGDAYTLMRARSRTLKSRGMVLVVVISIGGARSWTC